MYRVIRISLPDRPGALSAVTASLAAHSVDIVRLDVVSHDGEGAVDDLLLAAESEEDIDRAAAGFLPEVTVRAFDGLPGDPTIEMGEGLREIAAADPTEAAGAAARGAARLMRADAGALLAARTDGSVAAVASTLPLPAIAADADFAGCWVLARNEPVAFPASTDWAPVDFADALAPAWVAMAPCGNLGILLAARFKDIAFSSGELQRLQVFSETADLLLGLKGARPAHAFSPAPPGSSLPAGAVRLESRVAVG